MIFPSLRIGLLMITGWYLYRDFDRGVLSSDVYLPLMLVAGLSVLDNMRSWLMYRYQVDDRNDDQN